MAHAYHNTRAPREITAAAERVGRGAIVVPVPGEDAKDMLPDADSFPAQVPGGAARRAARAAAACLLAALACAAAAGCADQAGAAPPIQLATAFVAAPRAHGTTVAYVLIRNNGPADRLVAAHTSAGGRVRFRVTSRTQGTTVRTLTAVNVPGHGVLAMNPGGVHMIITGAGPMRSGKDITLTLVFARAGPVSVLAQVTNAQSGGSSYFLN
jgi:copper(I)-binding protein